MNKPKTYHSKGDESLRILKGEQTVIVVPMPIQPDKNSDLVGIVEGSYKQKGICQARFKNGDSIKDFPSPLGQSGDTILLKETWAHLVDIEEDPDFFGRPHIVIENGLDGSRREGYFYKADGDMHFVDGDGWTLGKSLWRSPVTMPLEAVRAKPVIKSVEPKRVQEITKDECEKWQTLRQIELYFAAVNHFGLQAWENNDYVWVYTVGGEK